MSTSILGPAIGIAWRPELAMHIERYQRLGFIEILAENFRLESRIPLAVRALYERGVKTVVHGVSLSLGGASLPDTSRLDELSRIAEISSATLVSEHIAFVRAAGLESGHLLPVERNEKSLAILVENINHASRRLPVPLALENIAALVEWSSNTMDEATFLARILKETDTFLLLDVSNLYANSQNHGFDPLAYLEKLPLERIAYMHVAGGIVRDGIYHDTHSHALSNPVIALLEQICHSMESPAVLLERDACFPDETRLHSELDILADTAIANRMRKYENAVR